MSKKKIVLQVCRSCIRDNEQSDPTLKDEATLRKTYQEKLKRGLFGRVAELRIVDCLTNCANPNSVQIQRDDGEILFGKICSQSSVDAVIQLSDELRDPSKELVPSKILTPHLIFVRPHTQWRKGTDSTHADRIQLK